MGQKGHIDGYGIKGETRPDEKMGRPQRHSLTSRMRHVMKVRAARKRRQRDGKVGQ